MSDVAVMLNYCCAIISLVGSLMFLCSVLSPVKATFSMVHRSLSINYVHIHPDTDFGLHTCLEQH